MIVHGLVSRLSEDVDLFTPDVREVADLRDQLIARLRADGLTVKVVRDYTSFVELSVDDGKETLRVEIALDSRIREPVRLGIGAVLAPEELAADKTLALFGRAYARDLVDVAALGDRLGLPRLMTLAADKDPGFHRSRFAEALRVAADEPEAEFRRLGLSEDQVAALRGWARRWAEDLALGS